MKTFLVRSLALLACAALPLRAQDTTQKGVRIGLTYQPGTRPGVVVLPVGGAHGDSVRAIIQRDLDYGDRVNVIVAPDSMLNAIASTNGPDGKSTGLDYGVFKTIGALAVVQASVTPRGVHVALHDVGQGQVMNVSEFPLPPDAATRGWRLAVHGISDEVERWITGQKGIASTRVAYVRNHAVRIVDSDGADEVTLPMVGEGMSPAWSPDGQKLAYNTFGADSRIVVYDLKTMEAHAFGARRNTTNLSPTFSRDGATVVYAVSGENGSDLYAMPASGTGTPTRLTVGRGSDNVQPSFSPEGRRIAFMSSRAGPPEIYISDADGTNPDMLTAYDFSTKNYRTSPDWSPDGRQVAYQSRVPDGSGGTFQIFTISLRDRTPRQLTSDAENEDPSWAPDGRHLVFTSTRSGEKQLWVLDVESGRMRQLTHAAGSRIAAWSPRLAPPAAPAP